MYIHTYIYLHTCHPHSCPNIGEMELHRVLSNFYGSKRYTLNDIKMMIKEWDFDNDGKLDFAEYKAMWKRKKIKKDKKKNSNNNPSNNNGGSGHENDNVAKSSVNRNSSVNRSGSANGKENMHTRTEGRNIAQRHASNAGPGLRHSNSNSSKSYSSNGNTFKKGAAEISMDEFLNAKPTKTEARGEEEENTYRYVDCAMSYIGDRYHAFIKFSLDALLYKRVIIKQYIKSVCSVKVKYGHPHRNRVACPICR